MTNGVCFYVSLLKVNFIGDCVQLNQIEMEFDDAGLSRTHQLKQIIDHSFVLNELTEIYPIRNGLFRIADKIIIISELANELMFL